MARFPETERGEEGAGARRLRRPAREDPARARSWRTAAASTAARFDEIRTIHGEVGVLPRTHGSALFTRGETQALVTVTLGTSEDMQIIDTVQEPDHKKRFMLHYNFPPFSVGEVKFLRGPGRREIGHGALAERVAARDAARRGELPLHRPHRVRHPGVERLVVDGLHLRRHPGPDGRGRAPEGAGGRRGHGPRQGRRQATPSCPTSPATRTTTATWTSRSRARATGITALQMDIKIGGITAEILAKALEQARAGPAPHPGRDGRGAGRAARRASAATRRASSRSRSRWTRSATSSGPAAR